MLVRGLRRLLGAGLFTVFVLPLLLIAIGRWVPVTVTSFMIQARLAAIGTPHPPFAREWLPYALIPVAFKQAAIASEDQGFADHHGFDFDALAAALKHNERYRRIRGGSTISQQLAKNLFLWPGRSYLRKALEAYYTVALELLWPKRRILEVYLNVAEFGPLAYGVQGGAERQFGLPASQLGAHQAALLIACLPAPERYSAARPGPYVQRRAASIQAQMQPLPPVLQP
jgi:monofunctional glycosyltransferase